MDKVYINKHIVYSVEPVNGGIKININHALSTYRPPHPVLLFKCGKAKLTWEMSKSITKLETYSNLPLRLYWDYSLLWDGVPVLYKLEMDRKDSYTYTYFNSCTISPDSIPDLKSRELMRRYINKIEMMTVLEK
jgi:hypothetical protein